MATRVIGTVIPGSMHIRVSEYTVFTVECGNCRHRQEVSSSSKMPWCQNCRRQMVLHQATDVENVIPLRRRA